MKPQAKRKYVYCESYGMVYRFTGRNWARFLKAMAQGNDEIPYSDYSTPLFSVDHNITDIDRETAKDLLEAL